MGLGEKREQVKGESRQKRSKGPAMVKCIK